MTVVLPTLGAPGVYLAPDLVAAERLGVRMDVCAFVGVAPRGPAWERVADEAFDDDGLLAAGRARSVPVAVESWAEYVEIFGAFEGPGLLPYSVAAFFAQGGRRAVVQRVVPSWPRPSLAAVPDDDPGKATVPPATEPSACAVLAFATPQLTGASDNAPDIATAADPVWLRARNEGVWGNRLSATLSFDTATLPTPTVDLGALVLADGVSLGVGDLLRIRRADGTVELRTVASVARAAGRRLAHLDRLMVGALTRLEVVTCSLEVFDTDPDHPRQERFTGAGLRSAHGRWLGMLLADSRLVELGQVPDASGQGHDLAAITPVDPALPQLVPARPGDRSGDGFDRYPLLTPADVLGPLDLLFGSGELAPDGLDALAAVVDPAVTAAAPASLVVPDLYQPLAAPDLHDVGVPATMAGPTFDRCVATAAVPAAPPDGAGLLGLRLDPSVPSDRSQIIALQRQLVAAAEALGVVALLDVPPGLRPAQVLAWRAAFDSSWAAAWHGWLRTPVGEKLVTIPPTGSAAGLIAATELSRGLSTGPALTTLTEVVAVAEGPGSGAGTVDAATVNVMHRAGLNLAVPDRDGVVFTAARTVSDDPQWRQLTARRIVSMIERSVVAGLGWAAFEPNGVALRQRITTAVDMLLRELFAAGAFAGATPSDSYFIRMSGPSGPAPPGEAQLICEIGVAPSEPLEFLLVRVLRADDGTLTTEQIT